MNPSEPPTTGLNTELSEIMYRTGHKWNNFSLQSYWMLINDTISVLLEHIMLYYSYRQVSNISPTLVGNKIVDHSDVVGASPVGAAPTTSSFST